MRREYIFAGLFFLLIALVFTRPIFRTPFFILSLLFGVVRGIKLEIWLHLAVGLLGAYRLACYYRLGVAASLVSAFVFMLSSIYPLSLTAGMTWFLSVAYLPWAFFCYLKAFSDFKYSFLSGFFLVLVFFEGGAYPLAMMVLFLILYSLPAATLEKTGFLKTGKLLGLVLIYALYLGAVKVPPGDSKVELYYLPAGFNIGAIISGMTLLVSFIGLFRLFG